MILNIWKKLHSTVILTNGFRNIIIIRNMTELELQQYLLREYPQENARCEWKEFKNLKNSFCGDEKDQGERT